MKKKLIALGLAGLLALSLAGCTKGTPTPSPSDFDKAMTTPTTLTVWTWIDISKQVALFNAKYPAIKVDVVNAGQGAPQYTKLQTAIQAKSGEPDIAQLEFQYLPTFMLGNHLLDLKPYIGDITKEYPAWIASQIAVNGGIWAVPQDTGPLGTLYRTDLLEKAGLKMPETWADFATAVTTYHKANPNSYLTNFPPNDPGFQIGLFWQAGAVPFRYDGQKTVTINLTSAPVKKVLDFWQPLLASGAVSVDPDWADQWYQSLANDTYATMLTAAWAPQFLQGTAEGTSGKWRAAPLPQWDPAKPASGNWGGSTEAVMASTKNPIQAAEFARFLNLDPACAKISTEMYLFPPTTAMLKSPDFLNVKMDFYGGQTVNAVFAQISETVNTDFGWLPFMDYAYSAFNDTLGKAITDRGDLNAGNAAWQDALVKYAQQQGFTVKTS